MALPLSGEATPPGRLSGQAEKKNVHRRCAAQCAASACRSTISSCQKDVSRRASQDGVDTHNRQAKQAEQRLVQVRVAERRRPLETCQRRAEWVCGRHSRFRMRVRRRRLYCGVSLCQPEHCASGVSPAAKCCAHAV